MKITATIIAAALAFTAVPALASQFCTQASNYARSVATARDIGVSEAELISATTEAEKAHPNPGVFVIATAVATSAYDKLFVNMTPNGYAYKIYQACERGNWEAKYSD